MVNNTSYKGEMGKIGLEGYWVTQGHSRTCLDVSEDKIDLSLWLVSDLLAPCLKAVGTFTQIIPVPEQHWETGTFPSYSPQEGLVLEVCTMCDGRKIPRSPGQASSSATHYTAEIMYGVELFSKPSGK